MIGRTLSHYRIHARLGAGGMGEVFRATDDHLGRDVALKVLPAELATNPDYLKRFRVEARALAALDHPNIVTVHSVEDADGVHFLTMGLVEGESLDKKIPPEGMSLERFLDLALGLADGLAAAHAKNIVHRDLKPSNVMVTEDGRPKILDFGLAKLDVANAATVSDETRSMMLTREGTTMGTVPYMSPEQAEGKTIDSRSDLFSLGVMFYEMLTGARPFSGGTSAALVSSILKDVPRPLGQIRRDLPARLETAVTRCLNKDPAGRYAHTRDLCTDLLTLRRDLNSGIDVPIAEPDAASVAVMPFTDLSPGKDQDWFCEGMSEELINGLSGIEGLRVAARASAFQLKGKDIREIGNVLNVKTVLDGSVRTAGTRLRVTAQLNSTGDGYQLWSKRYDRNMEDVFAVQDDIAADIVEALQVELGRGDQAPAPARHTSNVEAYHLYLKGRHHFFRRTREEMSLAKDCFEQALEKDPDYALAMTGLADLHSMNGFYGLSPALESGERARLLVERALRADERLSEAHAANLFVQGAYFREWEKARRSARRAVELNPSNVIALLWGAWFLTSCNCFDEALALLEQVQLLDPLSPYVAALSSWTNLQQFRNEQALENLENALAIHPEYPVVLFIAGGAYGRLDRWDEAVAALELGAKVVDRLPFYLGWLGWGYAGAGRDDQARAVLTELKRRTATEYVSNVFIGWVHGALGEHDAAFDCFEQALLHREPMIHIPHMPVFDPVRDNPRFAEMLKRMRYPRGPR